MMKKKSQGVGGTNWPITILLIIGCVTIFFPLYMAVIIAFKQPSEMTNDIAGALAFPSKWSFQQLCRGDGGYRFLELSWELPPYHDFNSSDRDPAPFSCRICHRQKYGTQ